MKKINKKGIGFKMLNWAFFRMFFIVILLFIVYFFASSMIHRNIDATSPENFIFTKRIFYSPNSIIYTDKGRSYPFIIDINKLDDAVLEELFVYDKDYVSAKLSFKFIGTHPQKEVYINKKWYERWAPLVTFEQYGLVKSSYYVLVKEGDKLLPAILDLDLVVYNE